MHFTISFCGLIYTKTHTTFKNEIDFKIWEYSEIIRLLDGSGAG